MTQWARGNAPHERKDFVIYASQWMHWGRAGPSSLARSLIRVASCECGAVAPMRPM